MGKTFRKAKGLPTWRRIALSAWDAPTEAAIHGTIEVDATNLLEYIDTRRRISKAKVTVTHVVAKAVADALSEMPEVNGIVSRGNLYLRSTVDIFLQVMRDEGAGLAGTTIRNADHKSVDEIAVEAADRVADIRSLTDESAEESTGTMSKIPGPLMGPFLRLLSWLQYDHDIDLSKLGVEKDVFGSAMVTNVGMFGLQVGYPPVFPLGRTSVVFLVGEVTDKAVVVDGKIVARPVLGLHSTFDHRIVDGAHAGKLAARIRKTLADPAAHLQPGATRPAKSVARRA